MQQVDDIILYKFLGKGSFGEVYLSKKKGRNELFATKKIDRKTADKPSFKKYLDNEIDILNHINHPNIVKLECIKRTASNYYIVMEYINGGGLSECLKKYMEKHKKAFPEEIVQHLMRQIISGINYLHSKKIIHRDLKLDNIMVNFDSENDKENLNMLKAKIKIIDFGFATRLTAEKNDLTYSAVGSPINMDPIILEKFSKKKDVNLNIGYDEKADIWSIGTVCYELLIGKAVFNAKTMNDLVDKVEKGSYSIPKSVSKEVVSFLNGMLQYDAKYRLNAEELLKHPFLTKNANEFTKMNTVKASKKVGSDNIKKNKSIWAIFNDEEKYIEIQGGKNLSDAAPIAEEERINKSPRFIGLPNKMERNNSNPKKNNHHHDKNELQHRHSHKNVNNYINNSPELKKALTLNQPINYGTTSFYGQNMYPNMQPNSMQQNIPQMGNPNMASPQQYYPSFGVGFPYNYPGMFPNQAQQPSTQNYGYANTYRPASSKNTNFALLNNDNECCIQ
jgi:serine/threonine protein kinase